MVARQWNRAPSGVVEPATQIDAGGDVPWESKVYVVCRRVPSRYYFSPVSRRLCVSGVFLSRLRTLPTRTVHRQLGVEK